MSSNNPNRTRKILVPLATMAVAAAVVVGSGATWTSTTHSSITATSGNIHHTNDHNKGTLQIKNLKPGDVSTGELTITNDGSIDSKLAMTGTGATDTFYKSVGDDGQANTPDDVSDLHLQIQRDGDEVYNGNVENFKDIGQDTKLAAGESDTFTFVVTLDKDANDLSQNKTAKVSFDFTTTPVDANTSVSNLWGK